MAANKRKSKSLIVPFHKRFNIDVGIDEAQKRFVNRVLIIVPRYIRSKGSLGAYEIRLRHIAYLLGERYHGEFALRQKVAFGDQFCPGKFSEKRAERYSGQPDKHH